MEGERARGAAVISASDRSSKGEREDLSGRLLVELLAGVPLPVVEYRVLPDSVRALRGAIRSLSGRRDVGLVVTTGGTGVSPRDVTPEATRPLLERDLPALALAMRWASYDKAPASVISRAVAGFRGDCLVVNLPGSPKAVRECFEVMLPTLRHLFGHSGRRVTDRGPDRFP